MTRDGRPGPPFRNRGVSFALARRPSGAMVRHLAEWLGHEVDVDFRFFEPSDIAKAIKRAGFGVEMCLDRLSYPQEVETRRAYLLARRQPSTKPPTDGCGEAAGRSFGAGDRMASRPGGSGGRPVSNPGSQAPLSASAASATGARHRSGMSSGLVAVDTCVPEKNAAPIGAGRRRCARCAPGFPPGSRGSAGGPDGPRHPRPGSGKP